MRSVIRTVNFYLRHPALAAQHLLSVARISKEEGIKALGARVRRRMNAASSRVRLADQSPLAKSTLANFQRRRQDVVETAMSLLLPLVDQPGAWMILKDQRTRRQMAEAYILQKSALFDPNFYRSRYMEGLPTVDPMAHYVGVGQRLGYWPNEFFDPVAYLVAYPDIIDSGIDPIIHYAYFGASEGRHVGCSFDSVFYAKTYLDVAESGMLPFVHFMQFGRVEGRRPNKDATVNSRTATADQECRRETIILVSHDAEVGGAQQVIRSFGNWLLDHTRFDVRFITMGGGALFKEFEKIAPTLNIKSCEKTELKSALEEFSGDRVAALLVNSVASGEIADLWPSRETAMLAFIHELPKLLELNRDKLRALEERCDFWLAGSEAVRRTLVENYRVDDQKIDVVYGFIEDQEDKLDISFDDKADLKQKLGFAPDKLLVSACGVIHWRKSPDKFIEVASQVLQSNGRDAHFVWIGDGPDRAACEEKILSAGLQDKITITGYESDIKPFLQASDVFLLPSEEDPFPLVCLYAAQALNPVICFKDAGGMPEFVKDGGGKAVSFGDVGEMSEALVAYIDNASTRQADAVSGARQVAERFTLATTGPQLLHHIREVAGIRPEVSVVVPNYNCEPYLEQRLETILSQSFQDFELILLDDKSADNSVEMLEAFKDRRRGTILEKNSKNSGSPFSQWLRGMAIANSGIVWFAEADDFCEEGFLSNLVPKFDDNAVSIAHAKSVPIDASGSVLGDYNEMYLNRINEGRWSEDHIATDFEESRLGLGIANTIPNASGALIRKFTPEVEFSERVSEMRMCGDWYFYARAMRGGKVAYCSEPLNFHRRHGGTVTASTEGSHQYFDELISIRKYLSSTYRFDDVTMNRIEQFTTQDLDRFKIYDDGLRNRILTSTVHHNICPTMPAVMFVIPDLGPGGGQLMGIRMANQWIKRGGRAVLLNVQNVPDHPKVRSLVDAGVPLLQLPDLTSTVPEIVTTFGIDLIQTSIWWSEKLVHGVKKQLPDVAWVTSMHGCHETILDQLETDPTFMQCAAEMIDLVDHWVYTADKNLALFERIGMPRNCSRIPNGTEKKCPRTVLRSELGLREDALILCLASRAIESKGWIEAVKAVENLNKNNFPVDLMLIGEGPMADKFEVSRPEHIHLYGQVDNLEDFIAVSDVGILPSYFVGESMPLVLLEMMAQGKPIIASDVGEIGNLLAGEAGIALPLASNGKVDPDEIAAAIERLSDDDTRKEMGANALRRYDAEYSIEKMLDRYEAVYRDLVLGDGDQRTIELAS